MVSIITTNLYNAVLDRDAGDLTDQQYAAIVNASALDYKAITVIPPRAGRLLPQVTAVVTAIEDETPASDGAAFQPYLSEDGSGTGYVGSSEALREACEERGYPISTYAGANGGG